MTESSIDGEIHSSSRYIHVTLEDALGLLNDVKLDRIEKFQDTWHPESNNVVPITLVKSDSRSKISAKQQKLIRSLTNVIRDNALDYYQTPSHDDLYVSTLDRLENDVKRMSALSKRIQAQSEQTQLRINRLIEKKDGLEKMKKAALASNMTVPSKTWERESKIASKLFREVKEDLHEVLSTVFPENDHVREFLSELCAAHTLKGDRMYIDLEPQFSDVANFLLEADLIARDPYDRNKVKLLNMI